MITARAMKRLPADCVRAGQFLIHNEAIYKILSIERPFAVGLRYVDGDLDGKALLELRGAYNVPSVSFLKELGILSDDVPDDEELFVFLTDEETAALFE